MGSGKDGWKKALAKGLIPKTEHLNVTGFRSAQALRNDGKPVIRVSGETFVDPIPVLEPKDKGKSSEAGGSQGNSERTGGSEGGPALSAISEQISTSMKSMEIHLRNGLGAFESRLKNVEQANQGGGKKAITQTTTKSGTLDLRQGVQEPPPAETIDITAEQGDDDDEGGDDDDGEVPEGKTRVARALINQFKTARQGFED